MIKRFLNPKITQHVCIVREYVTGIQEYRTYKNEDLLLSNEYYPDWDYVFESDYEYWNKELKRYIKNKDTDLRRIF